MPVDLSIFGCKAKIHVRVYFAQNIIVLTTKNWNPLRASRDLQFCPSSLCPIGDLTIRAWPFFRASLPNPKEKQWHLKVSLWFPFNPPPKKKQQQKTKTDQLPKQKPPPVSPGTPRAFTRQSEALGDVLELHLAGEVVPHAPLLHFLLRLQAKSPTVGTAENRKPGQWTKQKQGARRNTGGKPVLQHWKGVASVWGCLGVTRKQRPNRAELGGLTQKHAFRIQRMVSDCGASSRVRFLRVTNAICTGAQVSDGGHPQVLVKSTSRQRHFDNAAQPRSESQKQDQPPL